VLDGTTYYEKDKSWLYYVATPYNGEEVPEGFIVTEIPARTWAKFRCFGLTERDADADIWKKIYSEFLPTSGYEMIAYQLEVYYYDDGKYSDDVAEVWIDVRKKPRN
jgi:AraC family transcriptional regulator